MMSENREDTQQKVQYKTSPRVQNKETKQHEAWKSVWNISILFIWQSFFKNFNPHLNFPHFLNSFLYHLHNICQPFIAMFHV